MSVNNIRKGSCKFSDYLRFPNGFCRDGEFSMKESIILEAYGTTLKQLYEGTLMPENDAETQFVSVVNGQERAETSLELVWLKYIKITCPKTFYSLGNMAKLDS